MFDQFKTTIKNKLFWIDNMTETEIESLLNVFKNQYRPQQLWNDESTEKLIEINRIKENNNEI